MASSDPTTVNEVRARLSNLNQPFSDMWITRPCNAVLARLNLEHLIPALENGLVVSFLNTNIVRLEKGCKRELVSICVTA